MDLRSALDIDNYEGGTPFDQVSLTHFRMHHFLRLRINFAHLYQTLRPDYRYAKTPIDHGLVAVLSNNPVDTFIEISGRIYFSY
jgi:hypothetical protein